MIRAAVITILATLACAAGAMAAGAAVAASTPAVAASTPAVPSPAAAPPAAPVEVDLRVRELRAVAAVEIVGLDPLFSHDRRAE
jgi:hypothetical protein